jgi:hypothetical protein
MYSLRVRHPPLPSLQRKIVCVSMLRTHKICSVEQGDVGWCTDRQTDRSVKKLSLPVARNATNLWRRRIWLDYVGCRAHNNYKLHKFLRLPLRTSLCPRMRCRIGWYVRNNIPPRPKRKNVQNNDETGESLPKQPVWRFIRLFSDKKSDFRSQQ